MNKNKRTRKAIPNMLPREPLTKKARSAIVLYVKLRAKSFTAYDIVDKTLKAERMCRVDLYLYLHKRGVRWDSRRAGWRELKRKPAAPKPVPVAAKKATTSPRTTESVPETQDDLLQFIRDNAANIRSAR